jgi:adenylylsulfate kinase
MSAGVVAFITGLPSAGKSTFAERAFAALRERGVPTCLLDGDAVRASLVPPPGYSQQERAEFYETLANLAALVAGQGLAVLVAATAQRREFRERARALAPAFVEVFVDTPLAECKLRDAKGLYAAARDGRAHDVAGADGTYEPPLAPDVRAHGGEDRAAVRELVERVLRAAPELT